MKNKTYTWVMERKIGNYTVREQAYASSKEYIPQVLKVYSLCNLGWKIANLRFNDRIRKAIKELGKSKKAPH